MSTGTLKVGLVSQSYTPTELQHTVRLQDIQGYNSASIIQLDDAAPDGTLTLGSPIMSTQIDVSLDAHTGAYTARLSILATNTNYRGAIMLIATAADTNPTLEIYDDALYANLIHTFSSFTAAVPQAVIIFPYNGSFVVIA